MRSLTSPTIYAAGDSAAFAPEVGLTIRMACATAVPMAAHAADNLYAQLVGEPQQPFRFGYVVQCISLGRHDGLIQRVRADDSPTDRIMTGRPAAWFKEAICRSAALAATVGWVARAYNWWRWDGLRCRLAANGRSGWRPTDEPPGLRLEHVGIEKRDGRDLAGL